jgi:hypothetical protein
MRKELALFVAIAAMFTFVTFSVQAMPAAQLKGLTKSDQITQVRGGCGRGWYRNRWGHCRRI